ncbi:four helix bundle protein [Algoriphagus kandeliae]|uniref:Four helix bundle protein n=1 Tax=Algoriphagus kandeliae TaxID=2562278 RepID=A0A4Y9QQM5_9BACT|nr:four helix bundle protein [Algoriphagus kandeliae]TFV93283.1 four helix bundle protein [Algoriphagus kandeliae]
MAKVDRFEDLKVWKDAIQIGLKIYQLVENDHLIRDYRAKDQLIGAAISISNNIAEGFEYNSNRQLIKYLGIAKGSAGELRSQLYLLQKAGKISSEVYEEFYNELIEISSELKGFIKYLYDYEKRDK